MTDTHSPTHHEVRFRGAPVTCGQDTRLPAAGAVQATALFAHCFTCSRE